MRDSTPAQRYQERQRCARLELPVPRWAAVRPRGWSYATEEERQAARRDVLDRYLASEKPRETLLARRKRNREIVHELKKQPCMDCGGTFPPVCMDFDHRLGEKKWGGVKGGVTGIASRGLSVKKLLAEIAKCDLICANCHRIRTHPTDEVD